MYGIQEAGEQYRSHDVHCTWYIQKANEFYSSSSSVVYMEDEHIELYTSSRYIGISIQNRF